MAITFRVVGQPVDRVPADLVAVPVYAEGELGPGAGAVDAALGGNLSAFMHKAGFEGKPDQALVVPTAAPFRANAALLVGVGERDKLSTDGLRRAAATAVRRATRAQTMATTLLDVAPDGVEPVAAAQAFAEGVLLGAYQFLEYKSKSEPTKLRRVVIVSDGAVSELRRGIERGNLVAHAAIWARDIVNEPSASKAPADFASMTRRLLTGKGVTVSVLTEAQLRAQRLGGVIGVGQGSSRPPRLVKISYTPTGRSRGHVALVGKGVVFDSGGLSLKTSGGMETMKTDMSGAAAVIATMSVLRALGVKTRVTAYAPLVENMPSGTAIRPGDVLRIRNGKTVEVLNTDAEGRLILADALSLAVEGRPDAVIDLATLTGACMSALGEKIAGLMGNHDEWIAQVRAAADRVGEPVWPLPLPRDYRKLIDSEIADLRNISTGQYGGALTAGLFLEEFVGGRPWVHLDIAGPARASNDDGYLAKGGTGFGVRTLVELLAGFERPKAAVSASSKSPTRGAARGAAGTGRRTPQSRSAGRARRTSGTQGRGAP